MTTVEMTMQEALNCAITAWHATRDALFGRRTFSADIDTLNSMDKVVRYWLGAVFSVSSSESHRLWEAYLHFNACTDADIYAVYEVWTVDNERDIALAAELAALDPID